eukprot:8040225-Pyramimonas_sp.AAC.1
MPLPSARFPLSGASWKALVAAAGFASKSWSERALGEAQGAAASVHGSGSDISPYRAGSARCPTPATHFPASTPKLSFRMKSVDFALPWMGMPEGPRGLPSA